MSKKIDAYRFLGMRRNATPEEMVERCHKLLDWLKSEAIPQELRPWAREQIALVDVFYRAFAEEAEEAKPDEVALTLPEKAEAEEDGFLRRLLRSPVSFAILGVLVGVAVLAGVFLWWDRGEAGTPSATSQTETLSAAEYLASQQGRLKELEAQVALRPDDVDVLFELGETNMLGEQWEKAISWFTKLLEIQPDDQHAQIDVGLANMTLGRNAEAEAILLKVLEKDPENLQIHFSLGFMYASSLIPDMHKAVTHWQETVRIAPDSEWGQLAKSHLEQAGALLLPTPFLTP